MLIVNKHAPFFFTNDWNSLTYTCLTIKSVIYEAFVNPEESFRLFYVQITQNLLFHLLLSFTNEAQCVNTW